MGRERAGDATCDVCRSKSGGVCCPRVRLRKVGLRPEREIKMSYVHGGFLFMGDWCVEDRCFFFSWVGERSVMKY